MGVASCWGASLEGVGVKVGTRPTVLVCDGCGLAATGGDGKPVKVALAAAGKATGRLGGIIQIASRTKRANTRRLRTASATMMVNHDSGLRLLIGSRVQSSLSC